LQFPSPSPEDTRAAARLLGSAVAESGLVISLVGALGVGKTVFAKGLAEGLGIEPAVVSSPTFVLFSEYPTPAGRWLAHVDFYRVESRDELEAAGFADLLAPGNTVAIEWGDRYRDALPADRLEIEIRRPDPLGDPARRVFHALSSGPVSAAVLAGWRERLAAHFAWSASDPE
jgi:tRNA threonylcarbamoyladenosine biosynthesis protein TsaE